jgi:uncharacterized glyoxalase superfamily protein PhnB
LSSEEDALSGKTWQASPVLGVRNVRQAAEYYRDVLGFTLDPVDGVFQPSSDEPGGVYAIVTRSGVWIHFQIRRGEFPERERQSFERDVYLYVDDLDALHSDLKRRSAAIRQGPHMAPYGIREIEVEDLNGYRLTFGEFIPAAGKGAADS